MATHLHGEFPEGLEVLGQVGRLHRLQARLYHGCGSMLQQGAGETTGFHARGGGRVFLLVADHQDDGPHLSPVVFVGNLDGGRAKSCWWEGICIVSSNQGSNEE